MTVFVSYAYADRELARVLIVGLTQIIPPNIHFILDENVASPGENLFVKIAGTISNSDAVMVIISQASADSAWVRSEMAWALAQKDGKLPIFPVLIGPPDAIPHLLRSLVYSDFSDKNAWKENIAKLAKAIIQKLETPSSTNNQYFFDLKNIEDDFIKNQWDIFEAQKQQELHRQVFLNTRLGVALVLLIALFAILATILITIFGELDNDIYNFSVIIIAPLTGLIGSVVGFYFGTYFAKAKKLELLEDLKPERKFFSE